MALHVGEQGKAVTRAWLGFARSASHSHMACSGHGLAVTRRTVRKNRFSRNHSMKP